MSTRAIWSDQKLILRISGPFFLCVVLRVQYTSIFLLQTNISFDVQRHLETSSSMKLIITVTSATPADVYVARELTLKEGKPGILPELQCSQWRAPEDIYTFQDNSLPKVASLDVPEVSR